jgi:primosomal replication protein N
VNRLLLSARIVEASPLRLTPAGLEALDLRLEHESTLRQEGLMRQVSVQVAAVAFGAIARQLAGQPLGAQGVFDGFLASRRAGKQLILQIQNFQPH